MSNTPRVRYENTVEDVVAFIRYDVRLSPSVRRVYRILLWGLPTLVVCVTAAIDFSGGSLEWTVWGVVFGVIYIFIYRIIYERNMARSIRALMREGRNEAVVCEHVLDATPEGLRERTHVSEGRVAWSVIEKIETTDAHTFIYTQAHGAHIIPHNAMQEGDFDLFMDAVLGYVQRDAGHS